MKNMVLVNVPFEDEPSVSETVIKHQTVISTQITMSRHLMNLMNDSDAPWSHWLPRLHHEHIASRRTSRLSNPHLLPDAAADAAVTQLSDTDDVFCGAEHNVM